MTPEEAYEEALRRIRDVKTGARFSSLSESQPQGFFLRFDLNLSFLPFLNRLPQELTTLTSLQSLGLHGCVRLSGDLSPLAGLTSLQCLDLTYCRQLSDLSPLAGLTSLQWLKMDGCLGIRRFAPLKSFAAHVEISQPRRAA